MSRHDYTLFKLWFSLGVLACGVLIYSCLIPHPPNPQIYFFDKIEHGIAFLCLGAWFAALFAPRYLAVFAGLAVFGGGIEIAQATLAQRDGDVFDWLADITGIILGIALARLWAMSWLLYIDRRVTARRNRTG